MLAQREKPIISAADFDLLVEQPENQNRILELIGGEVVEVPSDPYASMIAMRILAAIAHFLADKDWGYVTGEAGGYQVSGERYAPDVAYISRARQPRLAQQGYNPNPPELAVEVDFPATLESSQTLRLKLANYLAAGTLVWIVRPEAGRIEVYAPGQPVRLLSQDDSLDGGAVLPGFTLAVKTIFRD